MAKWLCISPGKYDYHGKIKKVFPPRFVCSKCNFLLPYGNLCYPYCPKCGSKMKNPGCHIPDVHLEVDFGPPGYVNDKSKNMRSLYFDIAEAVNKYKGTNGESWR